jgi:hypothetical protein
MIRNNKTKFSLALLSLIAFNSSAIDNQITINQSIINYNNNGNLSKKFDVKSGFPHRSYVTTELYEIVNPGKVNQRKILYKAVDKNTVYGEKILNEMSKKGIEIKHPFDSDMHQNPSKIILEKKGDFLDTKSMSIINLNKNLEKERVYRLKVFPIVKGFTKKNKTNGVKIMMQYEVLLLVQPVNPILKYNYTLENKSLYIENTGNSNFIIEKMTQCDKKKENCYEITPKRIYADANYNFKLKYNTNVVSRFDFGGKRTEVTFTVK